MYATHIIQQQKVWYKPTKTNYSVRKLTITGSTNNNNFTFARKIMFSIPHVDAMPSGVLPITIEAIQPANNIVPINEIQPNIFQFTDIVYVGDGGETPR
jgi:hypothetical protein